MNTAKIIADELGLSGSQVEATMALLDEKATIPFIARYRKEKTGSLDEVAIGAIAERYARLLELEARKQTVLSTIESLGKLTDVLRRRIEDCVSPTELEDLYLPYRPHRKTRADVAREQGLEPVAKQIMSGRRVTNAPQGAYDIIAEWISQDEWARNAVRREFRYTAVLTTKPVKTKISEPEAQNYRDYFEVRDSLRRISSHRLLAIRRAEAEGFLRVDISCDEQKVLERIRSRYPYAGQAVEDSYKRLLKPAIETEFANESKEKADTEAIRVFADNLRQLLLDNPLGQKRVLALDPGYRTGCKCVVLSEQGDLLYHTVVYLHHAESTQRLMELIESYRIEALAIGNGTASRECEQMARVAVEKMKAEEDSRPQVFVVSENGASVYSASKIAREEFPDEDVTVRGAVSIGRRLMDPLAELVKIDPKSIGVGQYQHDVNQKRLKDALQQTVESVVNYVGVDVNTASSHLLTYISGLGPVLAQNIVRYRSENGAFDTRRDLLKVPKMGSKTFEQCAGFLRISTGSNPLDNTAVHPERYAIAEKLRRAPRPVDLSQFVTDEVGLPTLTDILRELEKPSRDPRQVAEEFRFDEHVHTIDDLKVGMELPGIVTNISNFGAFVDLGVHKDGLVHISEMSNRRISSPQEVVSLHQHVRVRVIAVDRERGRIQLSMGCRKERGM